MRLLVDGMNVIGSRPDGWWRDRHGAMVRLVEQLERWIDQTGDEVTVVFEKPPAPPIDSTKVAVTFAPKATRNAADAEIGRLLAADPEPVSIEVVTSDRALVDEARATGAGVIPASSFRAQLDEM
jgi:predicted RNA-binding protein with PIN domain